MKFKLAPLLIFFTVFIVYFGLGTKWSFEPLWALDYFNNLAESLLQGRLNISDPGSTYDLVLFQGGWYLPWGALAGLLFIPLQLVKGSYVPSIYLNVLISSLDVVLFYLILKRFSRSFFPELNKTVIWLATVLFAFGTTHFYVGTLGSSWHLDQMVASFFGTAGIYMVLHDKRRFKDYLLASICFSISLVGKGTIIILGVLPALLYFWDIYQGHLKFNLGRLVLLIMPVVLFAVLFLFHNYLRFGDPLEYGYSYIKEAPYLEQRREEFGAFSLKHVYYNAYYMLIEAPRFSWNEGIKMDINLKGNSILLLTPSLFFMFLAHPFRKFKNKEFRVVLSALWITMLFTILPSLMVYSTGWMQFGYRYSLDITAILVILSIIGTNGKFNYWYMLGILAAIYMHYLGITVLQ